MEKNKKEEKLSKENREWIEERLREEWKTIKRLFNDIDLADPNVREAIQNDPTLTAEQKKYVLNTGSLPEQEYRNINPKKRNLIYKITFLFFFVVDIVLSLNSLTPTGNIISNLT